MSENSLRPPLGLVLASLFRADLTSLLKNRFSGVLSLLLPLVILVANSVGKSESRLGGPSLLISLALTLGLATSSLLGYTLSLARDRETGVLQRLRVAPVPTWTIMGSRIVTQVVFNFVASIIVIIVAATLHGLTLNIGQYALLVAISIVGGIIFLSLGQAVVGLLKSSTAVLAASRLLFIVLLLLGLLGGTGIMGDAMKSIAVWTPVGALMTMFSDTLNGAAWGGQDTFAVLASVGSIAVFLLIGIRWFHWDTN